jgi:hypothetical protein
VKFMKHFKGGASYKSLRTSGVVSRQQDSRNKIMSQSNNNSLSVV